MKIHPGAKRLGLLLLLLVVVTAGVIWRVRAGRLAALAPIPVQAVQRQDIAVTIEATGTVEPIDLVEVKSKASGQILRMPVEVGSVVRVRDLLVQIDTFDVQNQYDQAAAALVAAQARADISRDQKLRSDELFGKGIITADEHDGARLDFANAQAALVKARTDLATATLRREDATVRAPISGTVLAQLVSVGQVIASATSSVSGGTSLLRMADLSRIRLRALVAETDIGSVRPGQTANVTVDAFPNRPFEGLVEKVEPQAVVQQSVTMFPVLISISNEQGLLMPGMNGEVSMLIEQRDGVLAVPLDAVRRARELPAVATALGMNPDSVSAEVQRQIEARVRARFGTSGPGDAGLGRPGPPGAGGAGAGAGPGREQWMARRGPGGDSAGAHARWRSAQGPGRFSGAGGPGAGAPGASGPGAGGGGTAVPGGRGARAQVVFVKTAGGFAPRVVRLGLTNFDYAEVVDGVKEGEEVALLSVAELQARRKQDQNRLRERMGGGVPGVPAGGGGGGGRGPGGGGH